MQSKKVLIVDDNDLNRKLFENLIGKLFDFESAKNGLEAIEWASKTSFDLILMDIQMPKMDGITAMKRIKNDQLSSCPILAVTAFAEESDRNSFLEEGFDEFITKPIRPREFLVLIQEIMKGNSKTDATEAKPELDEAHILDRTILQHLTKYNSTQTIQKVLDEFSIECQETIRLIDKQDQQGDFSDLVEKIHAVKGNSGTLGAMRIYASAMKAEDFGRNDKRHDFFEEIKKLKNEMNQFQEFLKQETIFDL